MDGGVFLKSREVAPDNSVLSSIAALMAASNMFRTVWEGQSSIGDAVGWMQAVLLGPIATTIAILALAAYGFLVMSGRVNWRRGLSIIVGCFILFAAPHVAAGLQYAAGSTGEQPVIAYEAPPAPPESNPGPPKAVCWTCGIASTNAKGN